MELKHVVVTSVDRDDVADKGAGHYAATIRAIKAKLPAPPSRCSRRTSSASRSRRSRPCSPRGPKSSTTTSRPSDGFIGRCAAARPTTTRALWLLAAREGTRRLPRPDEVGDHRRARRDERRGRRDDARPTRPRRRRRHDRPVPPAEPEARSRSTAGCTRTSSAGSASRARHSASARCSRARSCGRAIVPTSSATQPRPAAARLRTDGGSDYLRSLIRCATSGVPRPVARS